MPRELRRVAFSDNELFIAVDQYRHESPGRFPDGKLTSCQVNENGLELTFRSRDTLRKVNNHQVSRADTLRILIFFCLGQGIPMPRKGEKSLHFDGETLCLQIKLETELKG